GLRLSFEQTHHKTGKRNSRAVLCLKQTESTSCDGKYHEKRRTNNEQIEKDTNTNKKLQKEYSIG
ncbi:MAG TPA: hypothetical protein O0X13_00625, partial [Methanocorpusculum sp.]|nr:hypothetical protein [Methanocorpusculum sp.]